jgi:transcriptional regulator with XRE-family HTH domain
MKKNFEIGGHVKALRDRLLKSQVKFAHLLKVAPPTVSRWESGDVTPPARVLIKLGNLAGGEESFWFWQQAGIDSRQLAMVAEMQAKRSLVRPKKGEMVRVPAFVGLEATGQERGEDLFLPAQFAPTVASVSYFTVGARTAGPPFMPGDVLLLDESSRHMKTLRPFLDSLVLVDSTGEVDRSNSPKRAWDQLVGKLIIRKMPVGAFELAWSAIVQPWTTMERMERVEPYYIGLWSWEFIRGAKLLPNIYPRNSKATEEIGRWAEERAKDKMQLHPGYQILGRVIGWVRPSILSDPEKSNDEGVSNAIARKK